MLYILLLKSSAFPLPTLIMGVLCGAPTFRLLDQRRNNNVDPKHLVGDFYKLQESQRERE